MNVATEQFRDVIRAAGLSPPDVIEPGRIHRFPGEGKRNGNTAGWCKLFDDGRGGVYGDFSTGVVESWRAEHPRPLTLVEREAFRRNVEESKARAAAERQAEQAEAALRAAERWQAAKPADPAHPYLVAKFVKPHGIRQEGDRLLIPLRDASAVLRSLQFIGPDGSKKFLPGGRVAGCYFGIGKPDGTLCLAEGYATGASIYEATGYAVAVAFNAGNLDAVARELRSKLPDARIIVCADDDCRTDGNPGVANASEAALAVGGLVAVPEFGADRSAGATDFNDLAQQAGADAVKRAVAGARAPDAPTTQPATPDAPASGFAGGEWPEPQLLPSDLPAAEAFTLQLLPEALRPWIGDISERVQCPPDFPAVAAMVALGSVLGRRVAILPKRYDSWREYPNLWGAIVGRPGVLKSPALREALRPLRELEALAASEHRGQMQTWTVERAEAAIRRRASEQNALKAAKKGDAFDAREFVAVADDDEPAMRRFVVNDSSVEALGEVLRGNPNGTLLYQDELIGLLRQLDKEGNEGARAFYLAGWSGSEPYTFDRIGRGLNRRIDAVCLALLGSIQPAVIGEALRDAVAGNGGDGLLARFSMLTWPDIGDDWRNVDRFPDSDAYATAAATFRRCEEMDAAVLGAVDVGEFGRGLRFDVEAQSDFDAWREGFERAQRASDDHPALIAHRDKYRKLIPALALVCHLADNPAGGPIGAASLLRAQGWAEYLDSHARRAYASVSRADLASARELLRRIRAGEVADSFRARDIYIKGWSRLATPEQAHLAARTLAEFDYLREYGEQTGGRSTSRYQVNPKGRA
jgi:putative DNA primase/helicase